MVWELLTLHWRKSLRSVSLGRSILSGLILTFLAVLLLAYLLLLGFSLPTILREGLGIENVIHFLNSHLFFFFLFEVIYRFMFQQLPVIELEKFLPLPIKTSTIIHYLLGQSFVSPLTIIVLLLFTPFSFMEVGPSFGTETGLVWLGTLVLVSWTLHWLMLWFKQQFGDKIIGLLIIFILMGSGIFSAYYGWFNMGEIMRPIFAASLGSPIPLLVMFLAFILSYSLAFSYYFKNSYVEDLSSQKSTKFSGRSLSFFSRFGLAGDMANLELKLILRHKKSRSYLFISGLFLLYGLFFYGDDSLATKTGFSGFFIFVGIFITGIFLMQYGQLLLSWNSSSFDFYLSQPGGARELIKGKILVFAAISSLCFLLSVPYVFYGWKFLFLHLVTFLFNIGINLHIIVLMALWKPKPMDLNKSAMFNYEGVGIAQFLMALPFLLLPYAIYLPVAYFSNWQWGLIALGVIGLIGIIFHKKLTDISVRRLINNKYNISASFRGEI